MPKVSIILPVYNTATFLSMCIDSVLQQSYYDWELLLLDDGSTDLSKEICDEYCLKEDRIRVIHKHNTGVSDTRNVGLDMAEGKYVMFLDADDYWCDDTFLEQLVSLAEINDLDLIRGEYKAVNANSEDLFSITISAKKKKIMQEVIDSATFINDAIAGEFFLVLTLFKKEIIEHIRLNRNQIFLEDMRFYATLLSNPLRCMYVPICFYAYRKNISSVSHNINPNKLRDSFDMCEFFHDCALNASDNALSSFYNYYSVMMYQWTLETISRDGYYQNCRTLIDELNLELLRKKVLEWIRSEKIEIDSWCFLIEPILYVKLYRLIKKVKIKMYNIKISICGLLINS